MTASYHYDGSSFSSEAERDDYIRRELRDEISDEYAEAHDGAYPTQEELDAMTEQRWNEKYGAATPESAA